MKTPPRKTLSHSLIKCLTEAALAWVALMLTGQYFRYMCREGMSLGLVFSRITGRDLSKSLVIILFLLIVIVLSERYLTLDRFDRLYGVISALGFTIGQCIEQAGTIFVVDRAEMLLACAIWFIGWAIVGTYFIAWVRHGISKLCGEKVSAFLTRFRIDSEPGYFLVSSAFILICWAPYIIIRYPGGLEWDAYHQILEALGIETMTAHWPPVSSLFMGSFVALGYKIFGSYSIGLFMLVAAQSIMAAAALAYTLLFMRRIKVPAGFRLAALLMAALPPVWPAYLTTAIKDSMYAVCVLLYTVFLAQILYAGDGSVKRLCLFTAAGLAMSLLRNNGIYIVYAVCAALIVMLIKNRGKDAALKKCLLSALIVCLSYMAYLYIILPGAGIRQDRGAEALSIPLQQTALYLREYPEDVTESEMEALNKAVDTDKLVSVYDPVLSDSVKGAYRQDPDALTGFITTWVKLFFRHPTVYVDAFLRTNYGFIYPGATDADGPWSSVYFRTDDMESGISLFEWPSGLRPYTRLLTVYAVSGWRGNVVTLWLSDVAMYVILTLWLFFTALIHRRLRKLLWYFIPGIAGLLVCFAGPTSVGNNGLRYALPLVVSLPLIIGLCLSDLYHSDT